MFGAIRQNIKGLFGNSDPSPIDEFTAAEKRLGIRRTQRLVQGIIVSDPTGMPKGCSVRDLSSTGAGIELWSDVSKGLKKGHSVTLFFPADNREIDCHIVWRSGRRMGVRFRGRFREPKRKYSI